MHMSDALLSPAVGGAMWAATAGVTALAARRLDRLADASRVPLMGVMGAFVFAGQMVNFSIPLTGSSGHLGGGLLLAILLGPHAAFIVMFSVLAVQALFFADGGLLALGCNAFNLAFFSSYLVYPLVWRPLAGPRTGRGRLLAATVFSAVLGLQLGALGVVLQTAVSGVSSVPTGRFLLLMQPVHLAIGVVEGIVTASLVLLVSRARPEVLAPAQAHAAPRRSLRPVLVGLAAAAALTGGVASWFASPRPDGLEWSLARAAGTAPPADAAPAWPAPSSGTSTAGVVGALLVLVLAAAIGHGIRLVRRRDAGPPAPSALSPPALDRRR